MSIFLRQFITNKKAYPITEQAFYFISLSSDYFFERADNSSAVKVATPVKGVSCIVTEPVIVYEPSASAFATIVPVYSPELNAVRVSTPPEYVQFAHPHFEFKFIITVFYIVNHTANCHLHKNA